MGVGCCAGSLPISARQFWSVRLLLLLGYLGLLMKLELELEVDPKSKSNEQFLTT
jgi:hypothetical protein